METDEILMKQLEIEIQSLEHKIEEEKQKGLLEINEL